MFLIGKKLFGIALICLAIFFLSDVTSVFAQNPLSEPAQNQVAEISRNEAGRQLGLSDFNLTIFQLLSGLGAIIMWLGAWMLNISVYVFTSNMAATVEFLGLKQAIVTMWAIVRDLFNLFFVFGLIYIGFRTILDADDSNTKRMLGSIIVAALLINFSLYVVQVIVDFSNIVTHQISGMMSTQGGETKEIFGVTIYDIGSGFSNFANFNGLNNAGEEGISGDVGSWFGGNNIGSAVVLGLLFLIFYGILGFVFFAGAFLLITRFLALVFLMIFSPVMFMGGVFPAFKKLGEKWQGQFISNILVGPAYIFMLYISLYALQMGSSMPQDGAFSILGFIMYLVIVTGFLITSLVVARSMGSFGADRAIKLAGAATFGNLGRITRMTAGRYYQGRSESKELKEAANKGGVGGWWARRRLDTYTRLGDSSFDARNANSTISSRVGVGPGFKGGYKTETDAVVAKEKKYANMLGTVDNDDEKVAAIQMDIEAAEAAMKTRQEKNRELQENITKLEKARSTAANEGRKEEVDRLQAEIQSQKAIMAQNRSESDKHKEDIEKFKENLEREKYRRQLGTVPADLAKAISDKKGELKKKLVDYAEAPADKKNELREEIAKMKKELADKEKEANKAAGGYAAATENKSWISRVISGRDKKQNEEAGKAIRDEYKKKIKSKGDK